MAGTDVAVAWWVFWLAVGLVVFCGLIWTLYRLAVRSDEHTWRALTASPDEPDQPEP